jgi:hypothetical protein
MLATALADADAGVRAAAAGTAAHLDRHCAPAVSPVRRIQRDAVAAAEAVGYYDADKHVAQLLYEPDPIALAQLLVLRQRRGELVHTARDAIDTQLWMRFPLAIWASLREFPDGGSLVAMSKHAPRDPAPLVQRMLDAIGSDDAALLATARSVALSGMTPPEIVDAVCTAVGDARRRSSTRLALAPVWIRVVDLAQAGTVLLSLIGSADENERSMAAALAAHEPAASFAWRRGVLERAAYDQSRAVRDGAARSLEQLQRAGQVAGWISSALAAAK